MAKAVALRKAGKYKDAEYKKVLEERRKDEKEEKEKAKKKARPMGYKPYVHGGLPPHAWQMSPFAPQPPSVAPPFAPPFGFPSQQKRTAGPNSQCYNCQGMGHFSRDCPAKPSAAGSAK